MQRSNITSRGSEGKSFDGLVRHIILKDVKQELSLIRTCLSLSMIVIIMRQQDKILYSFVTQLYLVCLYFEQHAIYWRNIWQDMVEHTNKGNTHSNTVISFYYITTQVDLPTVIIFSCLVFVNDVYRYVQVFVTSFVIVSNCGLFSA